MAHARRGFSVFVRWLVDQAIDHWPTLLSFAAASLTAYFAIGAKWVQEFGAVAWGFTALAAFLLAAAAAWLYSTARVKLSMARYADKHADAATVNPLAGRYERQRIRLADFYHPFYRATQNAKFDGCDLLGPAHVVIFGSYISNSGFFDCEVVIVKDKARVIGLTAFQDCYMDRCNFFRVTLYMTKEQYATIKQAGGGASIPVISDGTAGEL